MTTDVEDVIGATDEAAPAANRIASEVCAAASLMDNIDDGLKAITSATVAEAKTSFSTAPFVFMVEKVADTADMLKKACGRYLGAGHKSESLLSDRDVDLIARDMGNDRIVQLKIGDR